MHCGHRSERHLAITVLFLTGCSGSPADLPDREAPAPDAGIASDGGAVSDAGGDADASTPADAGPTRQGEPIWAEAMGTPRGEVRWGTRLIYVPGEERFVLFGGFAYPIGDVLSDTWSLSARDGTWTEITTQGDVPAPRYCHCATYLPTTHQLLLVGGRGDAGPLPPAAWTLDLATGTWTSIAAPVPPGVIGCAAEWMPNIGRAIVYGGAGRSLYQDTYAYDPAARAFAPVATVTQAPPGRSDAPQFYDPVGGKLYVFSGVVRAFPPFEVREDLWAFDGTDWSLVETATTPPPRRYSATAYDPIGARWYMFGGTDGPSDLEDLWAFDPAARTWTRLDLPDAPTARAFSASAYDPVADAMLFIGGFTVDYRGLRDGWHLKFQ
ncbi:MAG: hypothetical protein IT384_02210 [Deltaproteobacteria bacterium]|nr:hypothetical protein [Deltaproteobacteria bacterium]